MTAGPSPLPLPNPPRPKAPPTENERMINPPKRQDEYQDRAIDCQEAMEPGFQAIVDCMNEAGWTRGETMRALKRLKSVLQNMPGGVWGI